MNHTIESIAYVELFVGNLFYAKNFYMNALKFESVATKKEGDLIQCLLKQGNIHLVMTTSLDPNSAVSKHVQTFGDGVTKLSFWVRDVQACFDQSIRFGALPVSVPEENKAVVEVYNGVLHEFLAQESHQTIPGFDYSPAFTSKDTMLFNIDHIASCHPAHTIEKWVAFYRNAFGFSENKNEDIYSEESGMHIIIMKSPNGKVNLPLVEPSSEKSPLNIYLNHNPGSGIHHIAFETGNIIDASKYYEQHHGELRKASPKYYTEAKTLYPTLLNQIDHLAPYGIMLEQDEKGVLFQIFTRPVGTRPTFFLEFIQREVCEGFGTVNIKALYETLEA